jgi:hypothetical protein
MTGELQQSLPDSPKCGTRARVWRFSTKTHIVRDTVSQESYSSRLPKKVNNTLERSVTKVSPSYQIPALAAKSMRKCLIAAECGTHLLMKIVGGGCLRFWNAARDCEHISKMRRNVTRSYIRIGTEKASDSEAGLHVARPTYDFYRRVFEIGPVMDPGHEELSFPNAQRPQPKTECGREASTG